jgi:hypothetical protein
VAAPSITIVLAWAIRARSSIQTGTPAAARGSIPVARLRGDFRPLEKFSSSKCRQQPRDLNFPSSRSRRLDLTLHQPPPFRPKLAQLAPVRVVACDLAIDVATIARTTLAPFHGRGLRAPPALSAHLFNLLIAMTYGSPAFIQDGVMPALENDLPEVAALRDACRNRVGLLSRILAEAPNCRAMPPEGGMFVLLDIRGTGLGAFWCERTSPFCRATSWAERRRPSANRSDRG